ncbi:MAG: 5-(carboxyamino)imidazole ribonucleotide synthase [Planctomycetes bacterium]|nr:5-(carboxyamino)imidazole ribonucleotide synthase [Planctomycetota bacterium]
MSADARPLVAILGGGQLGRMLVLAGRRIGVDCRLLVPEAEAAMGMAQVVNAAWDDDDALRRLADGATVATWEVEHVPLGTVERLERLVPMHPAAAVLATVQDRARQKHLYDTLGLATAPWTAPTDLDSCREAAARLGLPLVAKARRGGYDGRGQRILRSQADVSEAWSQRGPDGIILERLMSFTDECSIVSVRGKDGCIRHWPVVENRHRDGILATTLAPHPAWSPGLQARAEAIACTLLRHLDYVGVLAVEMFRNGETLVINEVAPRVHNSGHWTIDGAACSQFENHLRAILGRPLGETAARGHAAMLNCLGTMPDALLTDERGVHRHDYRKLPRPGRKVGHLTVVGASAAERDARLAVLRQRLAAMPGQDPPAKA